MPFPEPVLTRYMLLYGIKVWCSLNVKPIHEPILTWYQQNPLEQNSNCNQNTTIFIHENSFHFMFTKYQPFTSFPNVLIGMQLGSVGLVVCNLAAVTSFVASGNSVYLFQRWPDSG